MADKKQEPVYNASGTHIYTTSPSGDEWLCPPDYLEVALARGFELSEPAPEPLADPVIPKAEKPVATKAAKSTNPGD